MPLETWVEWIGGAAAVCTTVAFVPQIVRTWRHGGRDLSYGMLILFLVGIVLWLAYGWLIDARMVILANVVTFVLVALNLVLKASAGARRKAPPRRLRIAVDMDEVIADSRAKHLRAYNAAFGESLSADDLAGRGLEEAVPESRAARAAELVREPSFFEDLDVLDDGIEVVRELAARHEVFIASAAMEVPTSFAAKYRWLRKHFPFIPASHIVFCGDKRVLDVDVLIDDTPRHFEGFRGTPVLFSAPHNREETRFRRVSSWREVRALLLGDDARGIPALDVPPPGAPTPRRMTESGRMVS